MHARRILLYLILLAILLPGAALQAQSSEPFPGIAAQPWDGESRYTILVMGMDRRPGARDNLNARTDVIMLVSLDPQQKRLGIMGIPRDMHFGLLDVGELVRVNTLLVRGESRQENYGPAFAIETLQANLGMYIDAYVIFDFEGFIALIDALGGVEVDVPYNISDPTYPDMNYGFDPFYVSAGQNTFDGRTALKYVRTRHGDNDYLRVQRQMQVVEAARDRLRDVTVLQSIIAQAPDLVEALQGNLYTNLGLEQALMLGMATLEIPAENITTGSLDERYSYDFVSNGETVRVPDRQALVELLISVFGENYWGG